jgi:hypothetical protein
LISLTLATAAGVRVRPSLAGTQGVVDLAELGGRHRACLLDQVVPAQGGQPGAWGKTRVREREPQDAVKGESVLDADCHFDSPAGDVGVRRGDNLHCPEPGWVFSGQQHDRPALIELGPPDLASPHRLIPITRNEIVHLLPTLITGPAHSPGQTWGVRASRRSLRVHRGPL